MGEKTKKFTKYFGGEYMKYWYIAFAVTVLLMLVFKISESNIKEFKYTEYNEDGSVKSERIVSAEEVELLGRSSNSRSIEAVKMF